jgi:hypothetical protein
VSEEQPPRRFQVVAPYVQFRIRNTLGLGPWKGEWAVWGRQQGAIFDEADVHPDDLAHMLRARRGVYVTVNGQVVREVRPLLVELQAPVSAAG